MKVFISYSRHDESAVTSAVADLERAHIDVWLDDELRGGEAWWTQILAHIRDCTVFLFALSDKSLYSKPCRAELRYAQALGLPILPVVMGEVSSYRADPIFSTQLVDYRNPTAATGFALMGALNEHANRRTDLPDPLPEAPPIPYEYLQRVGAQIHDPATLVPPVQAQLLFELRNALHEEDDPTVIDDIRRLLRALRRRTDVTYPVATEIDSMLGEVAPDSSQPGESEWRGAATVSATDARPSEVVRLFRRFIPRAKTSTLPIEPAAPPTEQSIPAGERRLSRRATLIALGGTALLVAGGTAIKLSSGPGAEGSTPTLSGKPGAVLWTVSAGSTIILSAPTLGDGSVFVAGYDSNVYALDEASGAERWTVATGDRVRPSPAFADGRVYVASWDGNVYALDASTGEERWKTPAGDSHSFPVSPVAADQSVYFGTTDWYVVAVDAASGEPRWRTRTEGAASAAPTVADGVLYIGTEGNVYALDAQAGTERWSTPIGGQVWSSSAVADGRVFLGNSDQSVYALHAETGEVKWTRPTGGAVYSSPAAGGGVVYVGSDDKNVYALDAGSGEVRWKTLTGGQVHSSPAVADGTVYVGSFDGFLYALDAANGEERWKAGTGGEVWSSPTVAEKVVYVGSHDGKIFAVER